MGYVGSQTRSLGQILENPCVHSRGPIYSMILTRLGQNVCFNYMSDKLKMGHVMSKTGSLGQILGKPSVRFRGHIFSSILLNFGQNVCFGVFLDE